MDIGAISRNAQAAPVGVQPIPVDRIAQNRDVVRAVKAMNGAELLGQDRQLQFRRDTHTGRMVVQVVNTQTGEVIAQIPSEYVLRLAEDLKQTK